MITREQKNKLRGLLLRISPIKEEVLLDSFKSLDIELVKIAEEVLLLQGSIPEKFAQLGEIIGKGDKESLDRLSSYKKDVDEAISTIAKTLNLYERNIEIAINESKKSDEEIVKELKKSRTEISKELKEVLKSFSESLDDVNSRIPTSWGGSSRQIYNSNSLLSNYYSDINLIAGSGVTFSTADDHTKKVVNLTINSSGSSGNSVIDEILNTQGSGTTFTLDHTPISGTLKLFRGGSRITQGNGDYTISGNTITLTSALNTGETLTADYSY